MQKTIYARRLIKGSAKLFIEHEQCGMSWVSIKTALKNEFEVTIDSRQVHKKLMSRRKLPNESYHEYLYKMIDLASHANVEEKAVIRYVIDGIQDTVVNKMILFGAATIKEFRVKLRTYEEVKEDVEYFKGNNDVHKQKKEYNKNTKSIRRCYMCGDPNHLGPACPSKKKGFKCFKCNQFGHVSSNCTANMKESCNVNRKDFRSKPIVNVNVCGYEMRALLDSGSDLTLMKGKNYIQIGAPALSTGLTFRGVGSEELNSLGYFDTDLTLGKDIFKVQIHIVPDTCISYDVILGRDFYKQADITLSQGEVTKIEKINVESEQEDVPEVYNIETESQEIENLCIGDSAYKNDIMKIVENYCPNKVEDVGIQMKIVLSDDVPVYQRARRLSPKEKCEVDEQIENWLKNKIIRPSTSDYASPIVLVRKKNGDARICIDYRELNKKIVKERYPLPLIEDQLDRLQNAKVFSTLDLRNGFFHVRIHEDSQKYTAFVTPSDQYEFLRVPFGLCNSPCVFQKFINAVFKLQIKEGTLLTYLDDLVIPSKDEDDAIAKLMSVLKIAESHGLEINWRKSQLLQRKIEYLGHIVENGQVRPSDNKVAAVKNFPLPNNRKSLQSFLGLSGYFRKFIRNYAVIARPLSNLLRDGVIFQMGIVEKEAFQKLKNLLSDRPVLRLYQVNAETELHTDGSKQGYGAILLQRDLIDGKLHPIYYASGKTTPAEEKYISYELEVLAIIKALKKFRVYLLGVPFKLVTDCQAFQMTLKKKDLCVRVARWALLLEEFQLQVEHRAGSRMGHVDSLSRNPINDVLVIEEEDGLLAVIRHAQEEDESLKNILKTPDKYGYTTRNGLLYKEVNDELLLVVPKGMQIEVIRKAHSRGHFCAKKTETILRKDYYFKGMSKKVVKFIKNCIDCILSERKQGKQEGFLHPIDKGEVPLDTYNIDHIGPLPSTKKSYRHIMVVVDGFSKFVWLYPTKSTGSEEVVTRLRKQSTIFGNPRRIITDRGTAFTSHNFNEYCKEEGIEHVSITAGVPRGNGQVERVNRLLIPLLTKLAAPKPEEWHRHVEAAQKFINSTPNRSIATTPFQLMVGCNMRLKEDKNIRELINHEIILMHEEQGDELRATAKEAIKKIQEENKRGYDKKRKEANVYCEGDIVAIKRTQIKPGMKFHPKYLGPYQINKLLRNDRYVVQKLGNHEGPNSTTTSADHMKPWKAYEPGLSSSESDDESGWPSVGN